MRLEGKPLTADLEDFLPDFKFAFEGVGAEAGGCYYTSNRSQELNDRFGDLLPKIHDLEVLLVSSSFMLSELPFQTWLKSFKAVVCHVFSSGIIINQLIVS